MRILYSTSTFSGAGRVLQGAEGGNRAQEPAQVLRITPGASGHILHGHGALRGAHRAHDQTESDVGRHFTRRQSAHPQQALLPAHGGPGFGLVRVALAEPLRDGNDAQLPNGLHTGGLQRQ